MTRIVPSLTILLAALALPVSAQTDALPLAADTAAWQYDLDAVVVTGTRTPKLMKDAPIQTRLISARDIDRADATNVQDLLQAELPGVEFSYAVNQQTHLNFAGFGGQGVLFLVDGERLAGETMDDVDFGRLVMADVERIEIVRGASSALYGSNAAGGVINIITRQAQKPWHLNLSTRFAKHNAQRHTAMLGLKRNIWRNTLTATWNSIENYGVSSAANPVTRVISTIYGHKTLNIRDKMSWQLHKNFDLTARFSYFGREEVRTPDIPDRYRDFAGGLCGEWRLTPEDNIQLNYNFDEYDKSEFLRTKSKEIRRYSNVQNAFRVLYTHDFGARSGAASVTNALSQQTGSLLTLGADYMRDYLFNTYLDGGQKAQDCADVFAQYDWQVTQKLEVVGALRYDYFSLGGASQLTPKVNLRYKPLARLTLRAGYGMGFRVPTLKERFYDFNVSNIWIIEGNPDLRPEVSHNLTLGVEYTKGWFNVTASGYYNMVSDKIASSMPYYKRNDGIGVGLPYLPYVNIPDFSVRGGEFCLQGRWQCGLSARLSYAYTHETTAVSGTDTPVLSQYLPARPHALGLRLDYDHRFGRNYALSVGLSGRLLSAVDTKEYVDYYDVSAGMTNVCYPAYTIWKLSVVQSLMRGLKITAALDNLLDYRPKFYYLNSPLTDGISLQVGVSVDVDALF